jgi:hypothetical protein
MFLKNYKEILHSLNEANELDKITGSLTSPEEPNPVKSDESDVEDTSGLDDATNALQNPEEVSDEENPNDSGDEFNSEEEPIDDQSFNSDDASSMSNNMNKDIQKELIYLFDLYSGALDNIKALIVNNQELFNNITDNDLRRDIVINNNDLTKTQTQLKTIIKKEFTVDNYENFHKIYQAISKKVNLLVLDLERISKRIK